MIARDNQLALGRHETLLERIDGGDAPCVPLRVLLHRRFLPLKLALQIRGYALELLRLVGDGFEACVRVFGLRFPRRGVGAKLLESGGGACEPRFGLPEPIREAIESRSGHETQSPEQAHAVLKGYTTRVPDQTHAQALRQRFEEYAASVRELRVAVDDVKARLDSAADILKRGALLVRREQQLAAPPPSSTGH